MAADLFLLACAVVAAICFRFLFRHLPQERWQFVASLPLKKNPDGSWRGLNLTFYGLFTGLAGGIGVATFILLTASVSVPLTTSLLLTLGVLSICLPAAKIIATVVEKNRHGFTVGGASFVGILIAPLFLWVADLLCQHYWGLALPVLPMLAAMVIAYVIGEGIGRLACISFGCCYGKPLAQSPHWARQWFATLHHVFIGKTKKIAFAGEMEAVRVIPIQAVTCVVYTALALVSAALFFHGEFGLSFSLALIGSQLWRAWSETLRADYRGGSKVFSAYQAMAMFAAVYGIAITLMMPAHGDLTPDLATGLNALWSPGVILSLQLVTLIMFFFSGTSTITTGELRFGLAEDWRTQAGCEEKSCKHTENAAA
ncbi:MAG: prolipoprotein diacylglyceryl transferase family protein [Pseudomonadota bacterium]|uniref:prolipoprotein diacylglyceryl transferase family protein n=1 Tax=Alcanivorax sp. TaxID=1872427 RepID=UPI0024391B4E|nr:prolipoprotein diacylglyceryl transferase family protein [Alcanivorax sp.]MED5239329.1 prolipoprotein diacylglyceryl transferase family protein [Pseudomonadota bacterium]MEE3321980.1 prolipoprotein diacylglyceryl transferase family protein [Pseudomonadota bacterium]